MRERLYYRRMIGRYEIVPEKGCRGVNPPIRHLWLRQRLAHMIINDDPLGATRKDFMTKFIEALNAQIDPEYRRSAKPPELLGAPITLTEDYCRIDIQNRFLLKLNWNVAIWLNASSLDSEVMQARIEAMNELSRLVYGEIENKLREIRYMIDYGDTKDAKAIINQLLDTLITKSDYTQNRT